MSTKARTTENRIDSKKELIDGASSTTLTKAQRSSYEFAVAGNRHVNIRNCEYEETGHVYTVAFEKGMPVSCTCKAFEHYESPCKHEIAVLIRSPIMEAMSPLVADGGSSEATQRPQITERIEPVEQGAHTFYECECGRQAMRRKDLTNEHHERECPLQ